MAEKRPVDKVRSNDSEFHKNSVEDVDRRTVVSSGLVLATVVASGVSSSESVAKDEPPEEKMLQGGDRFQIIRGAKKGQLITPDMLGLNEKPVEAYPLDPAANVLREKNRLNRLLVMRLDPDEMDEPTRERMAEGVLAYSARCTHRNCTIKSWMEEERHMRCHCHLSQFAALSEGSVMDGPARRKLPMVPLGLDEDGYVVATDTFTQTPGGAKK